MKLARSTIVVLALIVFVGGLWVYMSTPKTARGVVDPQTQSVLSQDRGQDAVVLWQPLSAESERFQASDGLASLQQTEYALITLSSGNQYSLRVDRRSSDQGVEQLLATVDPDGLPGFALITMGEERMFGTLNTPEGVYELVGTQANFILRRAVDVDADRRQGEDYRIKELSAETALTQDTKQVPTDLGPK